MLSVPIGKAVIGTWPVFVPLEAFADPASSGGGGATCTHERESNTCAARDSCTEQQSSARRRGFRTEAEGAAVTRLREQQLSVCAH